MPKHARSRGGRRELQARGLAEARDRADGHGLRGETSYLHAPPPSRPDPLVHPVTITQPAVIGDQMRTPAVACDVAACASLYRDPAALGEADTRRRAVRAGWREDRIGRLICPACQGSAPFL